MASPRLNADYLSAGANRHTAVADWSNDGVLAFGADTNIAIWRPLLPSPKGVTTLLKGHKHLVKAVKFLPTDNVTSPLLVSGADDKSLRLWRKSSETDGFSCVQAIENSHDGPINCIATISDAISNLHLIASGAADASIKIWTLENNQLRLLQTIKTTPKFFPLALALAALDQDKKSFVLAAAGTRDIIQLFTGSTEGDNQPSSSSSSSTTLFSLQATLSGHEGWIRSLDFAHEKTAQGSGDLLLASASQDKYIRLWRLHAGTELPAASAAGSDPMAGAYLPGKTPANKAYWLKCAADSYSVTFEALLFGHEDWIYSAKWHRSTETPNLRLLSTSADNSLAIWEADASSGIWVSVTRLGEISREKGATTATGSTGGFWTGLWAPDGTSVACLGRTGSWRRWQFDATSDTWAQAVGTSGHTRAVTGISWSKSREYLLSSSLDQTTRLHAPWLANSDSSSDCTTSTWHEMSRPQIHGYDLNCVDTLGDAQFVSGADEKLLRVFREPRAVAQMLTRLSDIKRPDSEILPDAADMPVLGLSNKIIDTAEHAPPNETSDPLASEKSALAQANSHAPTEPAVPMHLSALDTPAPPFENILSRYTLWPETEKLYGHGYEISCLASSHCGGLVASACRASSTNHAVIRIFETDRWTEIRPPLTAHSLTATRLRFSPDDRFLLSVGRDRMWAVFERQAQSTPAQTDGDNNNNNNNHQTAGRYVLRQQAAKAHSRMVLDAAWAPQQRHLSSPETGENGASEHEQRPVFATAGRDKQVKIWTIGSSAPASEVTATDTETASDNARQFTSVTSIAASDAVTAIDFLPWQLDDGRLVLAVGTESGKITIYTLNPTDLSVASTVDVDEEFCPAKSVLQLSWRPRPATPTTHVDMANQLAIAGDDSSLRLITVSAL